MRVSAAAPRLPRIEGAGDGIRGPGQSEARHPLPAQPVALRTERPPRVRAVSDLQRPHRAQPPGAGRDVAAPRPQAGPGADVEDPKRRGPLEAVPYAGARARPAMVTAFRVAGP